MHDLRHEKHSVSLHSGMPAELIPLYEQHYGACDIWAQRALSVVGEGWKGTSERICSIHELSRTEFYNDFLVPFQISHAMWGIVQKSPQRIVNLGIYRNRNKGASDERELELIEFLEFLEPHLRRAFQLHLQFSELKSQGEHMAASLDMLSVGVIPLASSGRIVMMNQAASRTIAENDGLVAKSSGLRAQIAGESAQCATSIAPCLSKLAEQKARS